MTRTEELPPLWVPPLWRVLLALIPVYASACGAGESTNRTGADYLYVIAGDVDEKDADFLAVFDVRAGSQTYGQLVRTVPIEGRGNWPHHAEHHVTAGRTLFVNGWNSGRTFVFDLSQRAAPQVKTSFTTAGGYAFPHSYARLPNGNVLATFQSRAGDYTPPGGLVELDETGAAIRSVSGVAPGIPDHDTWPYSLLVLPDHNRVITTNTRMGTVPEWLGLAQGPEHVHAGRGSRPTHVQIWRLSDLALLATLHLPPQGGGHHELPAEVRRLANGDIYVNTFTCGLYRLEGVDTQIPSVVPVLYTPQQGFKWCAVPVVIGNYWIHPSATESAVIVYDLSDRNAAREVSRVTLQPPFSEPHYISVDPSAPRLVVTADEPDVWVMIMNLDPRSGVLTVDQRFREPGADHAGYDFNRTEWPHGPTGKAMPHGAVFSTGSK
ncbi:MAG TPA: selenium-binding protein SBP56-related protein [Gemmatimonadales bacterium]|nr:selenium-binding protein SBP56-related protein [Gemmatimonadales bacterium]